MPSVAIFRIRPYSSKSKKCRWRILLSFINFYIFPHDAMCISSGKNPYEYITEIQNCKKTQSCK